MQTYAIYIFDFDGTLTDTMSVWLGIFHDGLKRFGVEPPTDVTLAKHTHDWKEMLQLGLPADQLEAFIEVAHTLANERLPEAPLHTGALEMLQQLKDAGKRIGVFSTMDRAIFAPALKHQGLDRFAEVAIAGTDVANRKPAPDGIIKALTDMNIAPSDYSSAVYIGDKDTDVLAAHNAGIAGVLFYPPAHQAVYSRTEFMKAKPDAVIEDWTALTEALR